MMELKNNFCVWILFTKKSSHPITLQEDDGRMTQYVSYVIHPKTPTHMCLTCPYTQVVYGHVWLQLLGP
jgi:hypothetical protein